MNSIFATTMLKLGGLDSNNNIVKFNVVSGGAAKYACDYNEALVKSLNKNKTDKKYNSEKYEEIFGVGTKEDLAKLSHLSENDIVEYIKLFVVKNKLDKNLRKAFKTLLNLLVEKSNNKNTSNNISASRKETKNDVSLVEARSNNINIPKNAKLCPIDGKLWCTTIDNYKKSILEVLKNSNLDKSLNKFKTIKYPKIDDYLVNILSHNTNKKSKEKIVKSLIEKDRKLLPYYQALEKYYDEIAEEVFNIILIINQ